jgi:hypothetical protein
MKMQVKQTAETKDTQVPPHIDITLQNLTPHSAPNTFHAQ